MIRVYLSGGTGSGWQEEVLKHFPKSEYPDVAFYNPWSLDSYNPRKYVPMDALKIAESDIVFAYLEDTNPTALAIIGELMYAKGLGKVTIFCNEWTKEDYAKRGLRERYMELIECWVDFIEKDFGKAMDLLKHVVKY